MKQFVISLLTMFLFACPKSWAQMDAEPDEVQVIVGDSVYTIEKVSTQTELRKGWDIVGYNVGSKAIKYLWGKHSRQIMDNPTPFFIINPQKASLSNFAVIKLMKKKVYRQLVDPILRNNDYLIIDLVNFYVETTEDEKFLVHPQQRLQKGEYILININQTPHGELNDYYGYCFTIE